MKTFGFPDVAFGRFEHQSFPKSTPSDKAKITKADNHYYAATSCHYSIASDPHGSSHWRSISHRSIPGGWSTNPVRAKPRAPPQGSRS